MHTNYIPYTKQGPTEQTPPESKGLQQGPIGTPLKNLTLFTSEQCEQSASNYLQHKNVQFVYTLFLELNVLCTPVQ